MGAFDKRREEIKVIVSHGRAAALRAGERLLGEIKDAVDPASALTKADGSTLANEGPEPPIVARLVVEIRSDGSRTIARGALEDAITDQKVAIKAEGTTPAQLASSLARTLVTLPLFAAKMAQRARQSGDDRQREIAPTKSDKR